MKNFTHIAELTQSQLLLWSGQMLLPDSPMYNMAMRFDLAGELEPIAFEEAFEKLIEKNDVLRTVILVENGMPKQVVLEESDVELDLVDLSEEQDAEATFQIWLKKHNEQNFDLSKRTFDSALIKFSDQKYVWYFNQHHLLTDGWSLTVLYKAMADFYQKSLDGKLEEVTDLPDFQKYVTYEKSVCEKPKKEAVENYWKEKLSVLPTPPRLYGETGKKNSSQSERVAVNLGAERSAKLLALTKEKDFRAFSPHLSLFNIFSTVLFAYLYRVSGQRNLVIGAPSHNRPTFEFKQTPGMFIEIFPLQIEVDEEVSFKKLFEKVRSEAGQYLRNAQLGMSSPALSGSFNVLLNYISGSFGSFGDIPMQSEWLLPGHHDPGHHLRLHIHDFDQTGEMQLLFDFNTEVFDVEKRQNAPVHFLKMLDAFLENVEQSIDAVDVLVEAEKRKILYDFNNIGSREAPPRVSDQEASRLRILDAQTLVGQRSTDSIHEAGASREHLTALFELQVEKTPDAPALHFEDKFLTYRQFNEKANQLAHFLRKQGIGAEDVVAIQMERSFGMLIAVYGILKAGAAYLPIETEMPSERFSFVLKDSGAKMILTAEDRRQTVDGIAALDLVAEWSDVSEESVDNLNIKIDLRSLAYVIYTSGSTGKPKGVATEHRSICNRLNWMRDMIRIDESDRILQKTPYTFDVSIPEFFWSLQVGAQLFIARPGGHKDPRYLAEAIRKYGITMIHFVPSLLTVFLEEKGLENLTSLKRIGVTGEAVSVALRKRVFEVLNVEFNNLYGPTEAAVEVTLRRCDPNANDNIVSIGKPATNTQIYILDKNRNPVPIGTPGEIYIGGVQLARGYVNRPKLTAERFVDNPFREGDDEKMYRTGDLGRHRSDGSLECLGRVDFQIKLRGFRIELGEIEARLEAIPQVKKAVVVLHEPLPGEQHLCAYYSGEKPSADISFVHHLSAHLPEYMIPTQFIFLEEFPVGTAGKVDRKRLPKPDFSIQKNETEYVAPRNELEEMIAEIWQEVLKIEQVGVNDSFLALGGHSLSAIRIVSRINEALELPVNVNSVFEKPTIAAFAEYLEAMIDELLSEEI